MANLTLGNVLLLPRCPWCTIANPNLSCIHSTSTRDHAGGNGRNWNVYRCGNCGGVVTAYSNEGFSHVKGYFPEGISVSDDIPDRPRSYLQQACSSIHAPAGAVMLAASSVDSMLKAKGYADGTLYARIEKAMKDHVITEDMAAWAHEVRLDANDQRHADEVAALPSMDDAQRVIDFTMALAELLFVLPSRITRGRNKG